MLGAVFGMGAMDLGVIGGVRCLLTGLVGHHGVGHTGMVMLGLFNHFHGGDGVSFVYPSHRCCGKTGLVVVTVQGAPQGGGILITNPQSTQLSRDQCAQAREYFFFAMPMTTSSLSLCPRAHFCNEWG